MLDPNRHPASPRTARASIVAPWAMLAMLAAPAVHGQPTPAFPVKPVRLIVPFAPGGPADIVARTATPRMAELLGQPIVIENRGGAAGTIGMEAVARAPADGYTLGLGTLSSLVFAPFLYAKLGYDPQRDIAPISNLANTPYVLAVNARVPVKTVDDLVKLARAKPGLFNFGSSGAGSISHLSAELFQAATGVKLVHVPFKGVALATAAVVSGEIDLVFSDLAPAEPHARTGKLRLLAAAGRTRSPVAPSLPTLIESGVRMPPVEGRYGVVAPAGTPKDVLGRLHAAAAAAVRAAEVRQRFADLGYEPVGDTPEQYAAALRAEAEAFGNVVRKAGIRPE